MLAQSSCVEKCPPQSTHGTTVSAAFQSSSHLHITHVLEHLAFSADGAHLYVVNEDAGTISTIDVASRATVSTTGVGGSPRFVVATPDGTTLAVSNAADGTVSLLSAA